MMQIEGRGEPMIATRLNEVIREQGRKRVWIAEQVGVHPSLITLYANRKRPCPRHRAERIAQLLGVPLFLVFDLHERNTVRRTRSRRAA